MSSYRLRRLAEEELTLGELDKLMASAGAVDWQAVARKLRETIRTEQDIDSDTIMALSEQLGKAKTEAADWQAIAENAQAEAQHDLDAAADRIAQLEREKATLRDALETCSAYSSALEFDMNAEERLKIVHGAALAALREEVE
jgi:uncharacterized protein (UPF0335 family)